MGEIIIFLFYFFHAGGNFPERFMVFHRCAFQNRSSFSTVGTHGHGRKIPFALVSLRKYVKASVDHVGAQWSRVESTRFSRLEDSYVPTMTKANLNIQKTTGGLYETDGVANIP